jgi:hypothetical protein
MIPRYLSALTVGFCLIVAGGSPRAATLYRSDFENGTTGSWTPASGIWSSCRTVTTGTLELCQTDATAQLSSAAFDGDSAWTDYSVQAEAKIYNYVSGEIGIIGRAQDASHYYQLSLKRDAAGNKKWWLSKNDGGVITVLASGIQYFQSGYYYLLRLRMYKQHLEASISFDKGVTFDSLGFAEDTRYRSGRIGLMTGNTKGVFDNVAVNTLGGPNVRRFGHVVIMSLENQNYAKVIGSPYMPYLNSLLDRAALLTNLLREFPSFAAKLFFADHGPGLLHQRGSDPARDEQPRASPRDKKQEMEGLFHGRHDPRSGVPVFSGGLAKLSAVGEPGADLSEFHE